jgi:Spy/CpxP family protein refolding chaperone
MNSIHKRLASFAGVAALSAAGLFGAVAHNQTTVTRHDRFINEIETVLSMTPSQRAEVQNVIHTARQSAEPVVQKLKATNQALEAAVRSDDTAQIQRLSTEEGHEIGQLAAIRNSAVAQVYKNLTPDQQQKADALHKMFMQGFRRQLGHSGARTAS